MPTKTIIDKLERADGPDRELDCRIWCTLGPVPYDHAIQVVPDHSQWVAPTYTASIDAAMTLVPEGWHTSNYHQGPSGGGHWWKLGYINDTMQHYVTAESRAATPALALCIAAVRARSQGGE